MSGGTRGMVLRSLSSKVEGCFGRRRETWSGVHSPPVTMSGRVQVWGGPEEVVE